MRSVIVRTRNCQILTGGNIYMVSPPYVPIYYRSELKYENSCETFLVSLLAPIG